LKLTELNVTTPLAVRVSQVSTFASVNTRSESIISPSLQGILVAIPRDDISIETSTVPTSFVSSILQTLSSLDTVSGGELLVI
jgi:hypothetical protein